METRDKCKVTNFIINLNIQHEQLSNKSSSLIKQSILSLLRTLIFQILSEKKVQKVIFPSRTSTPLYIAIVKKVMTYWASASRLCNSCVHNSVSLWLSQNLPAGMCCLSFLCKPRNWYGNCFISRPSTWHGIDMLFAVATYISSMFSFPSYHFMYEFGIHLHYAFLNTDTNFYHFIFNVCTGTLAMEFLILEIKVWTDFMAGVTSVDWSLCF